MAPKASPKGAGEAARVAWIGMGIERSHTMLEKLPSVNFTRRAQTWQGNIDTEHDQAVMYTKTPVTPGGISDKLLSNYENMYGDLPAGSGPNSILRDEKHAVGLLECHHDRVLWDSDCNDAVGAGEDCSGSKSQAAVRRLPPSELIARRILFGNAKGLLKLA